MSEIRVEEVIRVGGRAVQAKIMAGNILFCFWRKPDGKLDWTKSKPGAQIYNLTDYWVSDAMFKQACRQAGAILSK